MSRLVAFGCSHTYGLELPDCPTVHDPPSKMGFPNILGKKIGLEVVNKSDTGASQRQITATILETDFKTDDLVIINWSSMNRRGIWNGVHWEQLAGWNNNKAWQRYCAKYHYHEDDILDTLMNINLANMFLKNKCSRIINSLHTYEEEIVNSKFIWNNVKIDIVFNNKDFYYNSLDQGHPDLKSHQGFAKRLFNIL